LNKIAAYLNTLPDNTRGALTLLVAAAGFSVMALLIKLAGANLHVTQIVFIRQIIILLILLPILSRNFPSLFKTSKLHLHIVRIFAALIAMMAGFTAVINMPLADATAIGFAKSLFVTLFAILLLKETVGIRRWMATIIGFCGVLIMLRPGSSSFDIYGVYAAIGAVAAGLVMVLIRMMSKTESPSTMLVYQGVGVGMALCIPAIMFWQNPTPLQWLLLLGIGFTGYLSQMCNIYAYKFGEASLLAPLEYTRILYATIIGFVVFSDIPTIATIAGAAVVIFASAYTVHRERQVHKSKTKTKNSAK